MESAIPKIYNDVINDVQFVKNMDLTQPNGKNKNGKLIIRKIKKLNRFLSESGMNCARLMIIIEKIEKIDGRINIEKIKTS